MTPIEREIWRMGFAHAAAKGGTCSRKKVGAAIFVGDMLATTGYNGSPRGTRHCDHSPRPLSMEPETGTWKRMSEAHLARFGPPTEVGDMENGHCGLAVHAETNAVTNAARKGVSILGGLLYVTVQPCFRPCAALVVNAGIKRIVYEEAYRPDERALALYREAEIHVQRLVVEEGQPVRLLDVAGPYGVTINGLTIYGGNVS